jgi:hypothetical protein
VQGYDIFHKAAAVIRAEEKDDDDSENKDICTAVHSDFAEHKQSIITLQQGDFFS